jgi:alkylated DNA nucleotide flippase Atl1
VTCEEAGYVEKVATRFPCHSKGKVATYEEIAKFVGFYAYIDTM